jgi:hypothetical protein
VSLPVVIRLLAQCHQKYKRQGRDVSKQKSDFQHAKELGQCDQKEEQIEKKLEFVPQHFGQKTEDTVLLIVNLVRTIRVVGAVDHDLSLLANTVLPPPTLIFK